MKHIFILFILVIFIPGIGNAQNSELKAENLFIVTFDGLRWQELFKGIDIDLLNNKTFTQDADELKRLYGGTSEEESRKKLMPFFWGEIASKGQIYGNRKYGNKVNVANKYHFSYPGYNEMFTGYPDEGVDSNDKIPNKNKNVLEFLNEQNGFQNKVAAFTSWDVFPSILNRERSGILVNSGFEKLELKQNLSPELKLLNTMQHNMPHHLGDGVRFDILTFYIGLEYVKQNHPRVVYFGLDETDEYGHMGMYDAYLKQAFATDQWIAELWQYIQSDPQYKDKTTMLLLCDHGRGDVKKEDWTGHGEDIPESNEIWFAAIGSGIEPLGEMKTEMQLYQKQLAPTAAKLLGFEFTPDHGEALPVVFRLNQD